MAYSKRKPYYHLKLSVGEFYSQPVRYLKEFYGKESEMDKPYKTDGRSEMHTDIPKYPKRKFPDQPDSPNYPDRPDLPKFPGDPPFKPPTYPPIPPSDPADPAGPFPPFKRLGYGPDIPREPGFRVQPFCQGKLEPSSLAELNVGDTFEVFVAVDKTITWGSDAIYGVEVSDPSVLSWTMTKIDKLSVIFHFKVIALPEDNVFIHIEIWAGWTVDGGVMMTSRCIWFHISILCVSENFAWNDLGSIETLAREASGTVAIEEGTGPYAWTVEGTGFTLDNASTPGKTNTLNADATACGTAIITVTDECEQETTGYVRCTTGTWSLTGLTGCKVPGTYGAKTSPPCPGGNYVMRISGRWAQCVYLGRKSYNSETDCDGGTWDCSDCTGDDVCVTNYCAFHVPLSSTGGCDSQYIWCTEKMCSLDRLCPDGKYRYIQHYYLQNNRIYEWVC